MTVQLNNIVNRPLAKEYEREHGRDDLTHPLTVYFVCKPSCAASLLAL